MNLYDKPIALNEDGVPMDEKDVERIWIDYARKAGLFAVHIENIGSSMPDTLLIWKGITIFQEVKIQRGNLVYFQQYQWSNFARMRHSCHPWQLGIVVWKDDIFKIFSFDSIKETGAEPAAKGKVKVNLGLLEPLYTVADHYEFTQYLEWLRSKIWKKKA